MIDQTGALNSTIQSDRIYRENSTSETGRSQPQEQQPAPSEARAEDTVSLSAEAVARYRNVPPASATSELQEASASETSQDNAEEQPRLGTIDIRA